VAVEQDLPGSSFAVERWQYRICYFGDLALEQV